MKNKEISDLLDGIFHQAQIQFGAAIKSRWFHDGDGCPGCGREVKGMKFKGKDALSLNAFIFREHGVLIAYLLCGKCARKIFKEGGSTEIPLHAEIEKTLKQAFLKHLGH